MMQQPMGGQMGGANTNTNTNEIKIDLGGLGKKDDDKKVNLAMLMMMKNPVQSWCPVCDDDRMTEVDKSPTTFAWLYCIITFIFCPGLCCYIFCSDDSWNHKHSCTVCKTTLYEKND